jgi:adenosylcobinamide-GDP ribazoletransferase
MTDNLRRLNAPSKKINPPQKRSNLGFFGLISFSTIIPLDIHCSIQDMARYTWSWPLIGAFIGVLVGGFGFMVANILNLPPILYASLIYGFALILTGLHHLDGLVDFGDGLMVHGDPNRRIEVMRDQKVGTGGIASFLVVALVSVASISALPIIYLPLMILVSEVAAKIGLITCCTFSEPYGNGTGAYFIKNMNPVLLALSLGISVIIGFFAASYVGVIGIIGGFISGIIMMIIARQKFKWTTGDILGASNEISRMVSLLVMVLISVTVI